VTDRPRRGRPPLSEEELLLRARARIRAGAALKRLRLRAELSSAELARSLGVTTGAAWAWEHGGQPPARAFQACWKALLDAS